MRKHNYILSPNKHDIRFCNILRCCNHLSKEQATSIVSKNRLKNYIQQGVVKRLYHITKGGDVVDIYALTHEGRNWINKNIPTLRQKNYYNSSTAPLHNIKLAEEFLQREHCEWLTEKDLRSLLIDTILERDDSDSLLEALQNNLISVPDGAYRDKDGHLECIEIINSNYYAAQIATKKAFADVTGLPITFVRQ